MSSFSASPVGAQLVSKPEQFDVMVTPNLYGNLVSNVVRPSHHPVLPATFFCSAHARVKPLLPLSCRAPSCGLPRFLLES